MKKRISGLEIEIARGDISSQEDVEAVVNAANARLKPGGGVAGAIHSAAGPGLVEECRPLAPIEPGEAVITGAYNLPNDSVIHCLGPVYGKDEPSDELLSNCYQNVLELVEENGIESIAFPAISTGAFGYPLKEAAEVAFKTLKRKFSDLENVKLIRFVLFGEEAFKVHKEKFTEIFED
ncbi:MAG: macro domain-containing protein [Candidatus Hadarchaeota archaeon]